MLVVVLYLEQLIQKLKVSGGPFATFGSIMRLCYGANPGGHSRKRVLSVCDELVSFFLFFLRPHAFPISLIFFGL